MLSTSRHYALLIWIGLVNFFVATNVCAAVSDKPPFYKISYQGQTAYLLGSVHVGSEDFYPMAPQIETAFEKAYGLVLEADIEEADIPQLIGRYGRSPEPKLQDEQWNAYCQENTAVCHALADFSPWMQASQLTVMRFGQLGYLPQWGVESAFIRKNGSRPIFELENAESQFQMFASFKREIQWQMVLDAIGASDEEMLELITAWRSGNEAELEHFIIGQLLDEGELELVEKMLWKRNINMSHGIAELMMKRNAELKMKQSEELVTKPDTSASLFVVVGAGHVIGDKGIPNNMQILYNAVIQNCWQQNCFE